MIRSLGIYICPGTDLYAAIFVQGGPRDGGTLELYSDAIAVVRQPLTINDLPAGRIFVQRSNLYHVAKLPRVFREYASAVWTDVVGVRPLFSIGTHRFTGCEVHHGDDGEPPFDSAIERVVQRCVAQTLAGEPEVGRRADSA
jgi:hypothetical protein